MIPRNGRRNVNVQKGTRVDGKWQLRDFQLTEEQGELMSFFQLGSEDPKLGPGKARGPLRVGALDPSSKGRRKVVQSTFTKYHLADHFRLYDPLYSLLDKAEQVGLEISDEMQIGYDMYVRDAFDTRIAYPLRQHLEKRGFEGKIPCWFYVCPITEAYADPNSGNIGFKYQENWPLTVIPHDPNLAVKRWNLTEQLLAEISLAAGWLVFSRFPSIRMITSEQKLVKLFGEWRDCLPTPQDSILKFLRESALKLQE